MKPVESLRVREFSKSRVKTVSPSWTVMNEAPWPKRKRVSSVAWGVNHVATVGRYVQLKSRLRAVSQPRSRPNR